MKLERLEAGLEAAGFDRDATVPLLAALHGIPLPERYRPSQLSPEGQRRRTLGILCEWLLRLGRRQTVILLVEDVHWADPSTVELLGMLLGQLPTAPALLLLTFRPDFEPPWPARSDLTPMLLSRLTRSQLGQLIREAARGRTLPEALMDEILRLADGVPLFAEEVTRAVLEGSPVAEAGRGLPRLRIPETLQDSLMARLDALGPWKELTQVASVLGREFDFDLLAQVSPLPGADLRQGLETAVRHELLYQRGVPPEASYVFRHALIRDAAYESMLQSVRRRQHRRVAQTLVDRMPQLVAERPELAARHWTDAGEVGAAVDWWQRAGQRALDRASPHEAASALQQAVDLVAGDDASPTVKERELEIRLLLGVALIATRGYAAEEVGTNYARAQVLAERLPESRELFAVWYGLISYHLLRGDIEQALELMKRTLNLCNAIDFLGGAAATHFGIGDALWMLGRLDESRPHFERAIEMHDPERDRPGQVFYQDTAVVSGAILALSLWMRGHPQQALACSERAISRALEAQHPFSLAQALIHNAYVHVLRKDFQAARLRAQEGVDLSQEHDFPFWHGYASMVLGWCDAVEARDAEGFVALASARQLFSLTGVRKLFDFMVSQAIGEGCLAIGKPAEGIEEVVSILGTVPPGCTRVWESDLWRLRGELTRAADSSSSAAAEAERCFRQALHLAQRDNARSFELRAAMALARLHKDQGAHAAAREILQPVYDWFTEGFDTQNLKDARTLLAELGLV